MAKCLASLWVESILFKGGRGLCLVTRSRPGKSVGYLRVGRRCVTDEASLSPVVWGLRMRELQSLANMLAEREAVAISCSEDE
jgi:hypothetical protein